MTTSTVLLILVSVLIAASLSFYQYYYKASSKSKITLLLAFLRFATVFLILLLLINPLITSKSYEIEKVPLPIVVDNSSSVIELNAKEKALEIYKELAQNKDLAAKFDVQTFKFDTEFESSTDFGFDGNQSNLEKVATNLQSIFKGAKYPTILLTDGNQTTGNDYLYSFDGINEVFPIVLGDTTTFTDLKISRVNVNKYAFHKNKFPVEVFAQYSGNSSISADFTILKGNSVVHREKITFSGRNKSAIVNVLLSADQTGLQVYKAKISSSATEKNTFNNVKDFAVQVLDQQTEVGIISAINHPDIGALKRAIETNSQRKVTIVTPEKAVLTDYNVAILYQPTAAFKAIFEKNEQLGINSLIITGLQTDFNLLNQYQTHFNFRMSPQGENYSPNFVSTFNLFAIDDFGTNNLPPLEHPFGNVNVSNAANTLLGSRIRNIETTFPLLTFVEDKTQRTAYLLGEGIWKWRLQYYSANKSFDRFDTFIDKTLQYLATNQTRKSLIVTHESFYSTGDDIEISAQYFNKNYEFDDKARLTIRVVNRVTKETKQFDLLRSTNSFKVNLDGLAAGQYDFSITELTSKTTYSSFFEILNFDIEKQFVNPDTIKLSELAQRTSSELIYSDKIENLIKRLLQDEKYNVVQRENVKKIPLIDSIFLLVLLCITLAAEWFIRKYYGFL